MATTATVTKAEALHTFWSSFSVNAWEASSVPDAVTMAALGVDPYPRITYESSTGYFGDGKILMAASIWYRSPSWEAITLKADEIAERIGMGGILLPYTGGAIWLIRGTPFYQRMADPEDDMVRRIYINVAAEYLSAN